VPSASRTTPPMSWYDLRRDLSLPGCAVCRGGAEAATRFLSSLLWEFVNDPGVRTRLRASHGFCPDHTQLAISVASHEAGELGMAILAEDLLRHVRADVDLAAGASGRRRRRGPAPLDPGSRCPACGSSRRTEDTYLEHLAGAGSGDPIDALATDGAPHLCYPHLRRGLALVAEPAALIRAYRCGEEALRRDLRELIRKRDYRHRHEGLRRSEVDAWIRGFRVLAGDRMRRTDRGNGAVGA
jgi:hypothetical protein